MAKALAEMTETEFEALVQKVVDRRLKVWLIQLMDALAGSSEEDRAALKPEFAESLKRSIEQAEAGELTSLASFRASLGK